MDISIYVSLIRLRYVFSLEHMTAKREREIAGWGIVTLFPSPGFAPAEVLVAELKRRKNDVNGVIGLCSYVAKNLWMITFTRDQLLTTSTRQEYVAWHLHQFRQSEEISTKWTELCRTGLNPVDRLLLQKLVSLIFADISRHRSEAVASALQLCQTYVGERPESCKRERLE